MRLHKGAVLISELGEPHPIGACFRQNINLERMTLYFLSKLYTGFAYKEVTVFKL